MSLYLHTSTVSISSPSYISEIPTNVRHLCSIVIVILATKQQSNIHHHNTCSITKLPCLPLLQNRVKQIHSRGNTTPPHTDFQVFKNASQIVPPNHASSPFPISLIPCITRRTPAAQTDPTPSLTDQISAPAPFPPHMLRAPSEPTRSALA